MKSYTCIWRDSNGIPHIDAKDELELYFCMGVVHAVDRGLQLLLMKILGQGRASELLDSSETTLDIDRFFRKMNWMKHTDKEIGKLGLREKEILLSYCRGIDDGLKDRYPWELKLMGVKPEKWNPEDTVMISRMIGYLTLSQSQGEMERLFVEMVQAGISRDMLEELFPGILNEFEPDMIQKIQLQERIVPPTVLWNIAVPRMMASNNWVISGSKTRSGKPILANDPHVETNRLPNVWCEMAATLNGQYVMGASMPGTPGILVGRNADLAWGVTYSFADGIDSWVEQCRDGKYLREDRWEAFRIRTEIIKRKKKEPVTLVFYENDHGVLDGDPFQEGYYLATRWASAESGSDSLTSAIHMRNAATVTEGMNHLGKLETSWNWVLADLQGNIGYQMSGLVPKRRHGISGFVPPGLRAITGTRFSEVSPNKRYKLIPCPGDTFGGSP